MAWAFLWCLTGTLPGLLFLKELSRLQLGNDEDLRRVPFGIKAPPDN